jgi:hypothetical protein
MDIDTEFGSRIRSSIREHLALLAEPAKQRKYERDVPNAAVAAELVCIWFDDIYHPETPEHQVAFTSAERAALEEFNRFFSAAAERLGPIYDLAELQARSEWTDLTRAAGEVLQTIPAALPNQPLQRT